MYNIIGIDTELQALNNYTLESDEETRLYVLEPGSQERRALIYQASIETIEPQEIPKSTLKLLELPPTEKYNVRDPCAVQLLQMEGLVNCLIGQDMRPAPGRVLSGHAAFQYLFRNDQYLRMQQPDWLRFAYESAPNCSLALYTQSLYPNYSKPSWGAAGNQVPNRCQIGTDQAPIRRLDIPYTAP